MNCEAQWHIIIASNPLTCVVALTFHGFTHRKRSVFPSFHNHLAGAAKCHRTHKFINEQTHINEPLSHGELIWALASGLSIMNDRMNKLFQTFTALSHTYKRNHRQSFNSTFLAPYKSIKLNCTHCHPSLALYHLYLSDNRRTMCDDVNHYPATNRIESNRCTVRSLIALPGRVFREKSSEE